VKDSISKFVLFFFLSLCFVLPKSSFATDNIPDCGTDKANFPPNKDCYNLPKTFNIGIDSYPKTCIIEPKVTYTDERSYPGPYTSDIYILVDTNTKEAELGGYGPDPKTYEETNPDLLAQQYLYNALLYRPIYDPANPSPKESYRTYWRLTPARVQQNYKSYAMDKVQDKNKIPNLFFPYINGGSKVKTSDTRKIFDKLWWHVYLYEAIPPYILTQCLIKQPVCQFSDGARESLAVFFDDHDLMAEYDAMLPFDFSNARGYTAINDSVDQPLSNLFFGGKPMSSIVKENIPYVSAINDAIWVEKFGLIRSLEPSWNVASLSSSTKKYNQGVAPIGEEKNYKDKIMANTIPTCPTPPLSYNLVSPYTYPKDPDHYQIIIIKGSDLSWSEHTECSPSYYGFCALGTYDSSTDMCCSTKYKVTGNGKGKAITVLNPPQTGQIRDLVYQDPNSLYKSFIPASIPVVKESKIDAPVATNQVLGTVITGSSSVNNSTEPIYRESNLAQDAVHTLQNCWFVPGPFQGSTKCNKAESENTCDGTPKPMDNPDGCSLCSTFLDSKIPPNLKKLIEAAASKYQVPPSLILAQMFSEGGFQDRCAHGGYNDAEILACKIDNCGKCNVYQGEDGGPFGWMSIWFDPEIKNVYKDFGIERSQGDMCNMWDSTMASANALSTGANGGDFAAALAWYEAQIGGSTGDDPNSCAGVKYNTSGSTGNSCNKDAWSKSNVMTAIRWEQGFCGENIDEATKGNLPFTQSQMLAHTYHFLAIYNCAQDLHEANFAPPDQVKAWIQEELSKIPN